MSKKALIFAGQGSQYVGMGKQLYDNFPEARDVFDKANEVLQFDIKKLCFEGPKEKLDQTVNTQPAVFTYNLAAYAVLKNPEIDFVAGHSLGEVCASVCSQSIALEEGLKIVKERAVLMQESADKHDGAMFAVIGLTAQELSLLLADHENLYLSNFNSPLQITVSGPKKELEEAKKKLEGKAKMVVELSVGGAFHSPFMQEASNKFKNFLKTITFEDARIPLIANFDAQLKKKAGEIKEALVNQISAPVQFVKTLNFLAGNDVNIFVEIGPGKVISNLIKRNLPKANTFSTESVDTLGTTLNNL